MYQFSRDWELAAQAGLWWFPIVTEKRLPSRLLLACLTGIAFAALGWLLSSLWTDDRGMEKLPGPHDSAVDFLISSDGSATVEEVAARPEWRRWQGEESLRADGGKTLWLRVSLRNPQPAAVHGVLANAVRYIDRAELFTPDTTAPGGWRRDRSGEWTPLREKAAWGRETAFPITIPERGQTTVYLKLEDYLAVYMEPVWWPDQEAFHAMRMHHTLMEGLYFGAVLALLFYHAVLWAGLRFPDAGSYLLYLVFFAVFMIASRGDLPLLGWATGSPVMEMILTAALALSGLFLMEFARGFLGLPPRDGRSLRIAQGILFFLFLASFLMPWSPAKEWFSYISIGIAAAHLVLLRAAVFAWRRGNRGPRYLAMVFGLVFSGLLPVATMWLKLLPLDRAEVIVMAGSAAEMLLLSLAVAFRYAALQQEKIAAQQDLLEEAKQRGILQEAYADELELEVLGRTRELQAAVSDKDRMIAILAHDLCSPLTGLTRRAEQLAAYPDGPALESFTRDTAQMGQQLLDLIGDLVSWAHLRAGTAHVAPHTALALVEPMVALHHDAAARRGLTLETVLPDGQRVATDLVQAQTLVRNLVSNAVKFARSRVHVTAQRVPEGVRLAVRDDGPGLSPETVDRLFSDAADQHADTSGLGLRLCREIGRTLGIGLDVASVAGGGTEVSFILGVPEEEDKP